MTISAARLNANRQNSLRSKGPVSEAGKARVRMNAFKHGMRAESDLVAPEEADLVADRRRAWAPSFPTGGDPRQGWLVDQIVLATVRIDRCQEHQRTQAVADAGRAADAWEVDRDAEAAALGARLAKDPDRVVAKLCRSLAGVDWLLGRWRGLAELLEADGGWDDARRGLCLDLTRTPEPFREAEARRLAALPIDRLRDLVAAQLDGLESLRGPAARLDEADRALAERGRPTAEGADSRRLRRYEAALWRRYRSLEASWKAARPAPAAVDDPLDFDDDGPLADLVAEPWMIESEREPEPEPPPPDPTPRPGPPGPRPDRARHRTAPTPPPAPAPIAPEPAPAARTAPVAAPDALPGPAGPAVILNRRARRALLKKAKARR